MSILVWLGIIAPEAPPPTATSVPVKYWYNQEKVRDYLRNRVMDA